ncbi:MAG: cache domain-containing protein [Syntrophales bacterium]|nr:cache domain-containing protein [Syntrophales bacterium]
MKKFIVLVSCVMLLACVSLSAAEDKGTPTEARAMLKKAVAYVKEAGRAKALAEMNNPKGKFIHKDLYISVISMDGTVLVHPYTPALVGKNIMEFKDADGKAYVKEKVALAKAKGSGTVDYKWTNPKAKKLEKKQAYFELVDNMVLSCGYYR